MTLGKSTDTGGRYVRFGDEPKAYTTWSQRISGSTSRAKNWADTHLLDLKPDDIAKVEIGFSEGNPVIVSRTGKDQPWTTDGLPPGQRVKADKISALLSSLGSLRFLDTNDPAEPNAVAAKINSRVCKLTTFDGKTVSIALGRKPEVKKPKAIDAEVKPAAPSPVPAGSPAKPEEKPGQAMPGEPPKPAAPEIETIPAGPAFAFITDSDPKAALNNVMQKRSFQISEYALTSLPAKPAELFEPVPPFPEPKAVEPKKP